MPVDLDAADGAAHGSCSISEHDTRWFVLQYGTRAPIDPDDCERLLDETAAFWRGSIHTCDGSGCPFAG